MSSEARTRKALDDLGAKTVTDDPGSQFLDDAEQEKVVNELRASAKSHSKWTRGFLLCLLGSLTFYALTRLLAVVQDPELATSWQYELQSPLPYNRAMLSFVCQSAAMVAALVVIYGVPSSIMTTALATGCGLSVLPLLLWLRIMFDEHFPWDMYWVPLSGPSALLIAWYEYFDRDVRRLETDVEDLEQLRYKFKDI